MTGDENPSRNVELKVRCDDAGGATIRYRLAELGAGPLPRLTQLDTYFAVPRGRLKLRVTDVARRPSTAELIAYARPDREGARWSSYVRVPVAVADADGLRSALAETVGIRISVAKSREVTVLGATRVHLDAVEGLGAFVELETVVSTQSEEEAAAELGEIVRLLGLERFETVASSYSDLLLNAVGHDEPAARPGAAEREGE